MSGNTLKQKAAALNLDPKGKHQLIRRLIVDGFFDRPVSSRDVVHKIRERFGKKWKTNHVQTYMQKFVAGDIIQAVKPDSQNQNFWLLTSISRERALKELQKNRKVREIEEQLFSKSLTQKLKKEFGPELHDLEDNFGRNGISTAFLLRKILEKLIIIVFGKKGKQQLLEDKAKPGGWKGLESLIDIASQEKVNGVPFLIPRTAREVKGIKFLGDTAAHNPLASVDMNSIIPQMPFIITAYEELARRL